MDESAVDPLMEVMVFLHLNSLKKESNPEARRLIEYIVGRMKGGGHSAEICSALRSLYLHMVELPLQVLHDIGATSEARNHLSKERVALLEMEQRVFGSEPGKGDTHG